MNKILKYLIVYPYKFIILLCRYFISIIFRVVPISKNKIVICSYFGKGYGDNAKYIVDELLKNGGFDIVWALNDDYYNSELPSGIRRVKYGSLSYLYELSTAKVWIDNSRKKIMPLKREKQYYIQTWHAGLGLKRGEKFASDSLSKSYNFLAKIDSKNADLFISNSKWETKLYYDAFWYNGEVLEFGLPRNDILVNSNNYSEIKNKLLKYLNLKSNQKIILYAPTFRSDSNINCYNINYNKILETLEKKTNSKWVFLVRLHPNIEKLDLNIEFNDKIIDVTHYSDLNDIMISSDVLISDYSSLMFDFSYMKKPVFLFTTDLEDYTNDRGFLFDLNKLPFYLCIDNDKLIESINNFSNESYLKRLDKFFYDVGLNETGKASYEVARRIMEVCGINEKK